ncbi:hypothetical protein [uncultured Microbulbifer sp.]|uniref:hypothetical protein n=1 Tax=uncultured Microbulbifer sp. TaxID=348147 RepID=UPI0025CFCC14|nr:hypothetical protein [uncultured Microbulbifer sp.]
MKRSVAGLVATFGSATLLAMAGCSNMENTTESTSARNLGGQPGYYSVRGKNYHCHQDGRCHTVRDPNYFWRAGQYRAGRPSHYHRYPQPPR